MTLNKSIVEDATLSWLGDQGYAIEQGVRITTRDLRVMYADESVTETRA